jgi:hypothetical protein
VDGWRNVPWTACSLLPLSRRRPAGGDFRTESSAARLQAGKHADAIKVLANAEEKHAYFGGVLDASAMLTAEAKAGVE